MSADLDFYFKEVKETVEELQQES